MRRLSFLLLVAAASMLLFSCSTSRESFNPEKKFSVATLQQDYQLFRNILEESHPSLYWFVPKDSMDYFFDQGYRQIDQYMTEQQFKSLLTYVASKIRCGHTSVRSSRNYNRYFDTARVKIFPLSLKIWPDSMAVIANLHRKDSVLKRGTIIKSINGLNTHQFRDTFFNYISTDGNAINGKYQSLSSRGSFGVLYRNVLGLTDQFDIQYIDEYGQEKETIIPLYDPKTDTLVRGLEVISPHRAVAKDEVRLFVLNAARNVQIDTTLSSAYMTVNTFSRGNRLKSFFNRSFKTIRQNNIRNLVVDVRANGGGDANFSTLLTKYLIDKKFKLADSLYAINRSSHYGKFIQRNFLYWIAMNLVTRKRSDGYYHFGFFERHHFKPKKRFHFDGDIYIITGGNSFSATTLFAKMLKGQKNVTIVGEETGGGSYGNTAWMIPDVTLPNTKIRFRLPKFRLVMDKAAVKEARGVLPDIEVVPTAEDIRNSIDPKTEKVRTLILQRQQLTRQ